MNIGRWSYILYIDSSLTTIWGSSEIIQNTISHLSRLQNWHECLFKKEGEAFAKREEENAERQRAAIRILDEEAKRKVKLYLVDENQVDPGTYLDNVNRFRPIGVADNNSAGIDTQIGLPKPAFVDDSPNVNDYVWAEMMCIESPPESWPAFDDDFPDEQMCVETLTQALSADGCHTAKETSNMWTAFHVWMKYAGRRMQDPPPTSQEGRDEFYRKFVRSSFLQKSTKMGTHVASKVCSSKRITQKLVSMLVST